MAPSRLGVSQSPGRATASPAADVGAAAADVLSGRGLGEDVHALGVRFAVSSTITTASAPSGSGAPVAISRARAGLDRAPARPARVDPVDDAQMDGTVVGGVAVVSAATTA